MPLSRPEIRKLLDERFMTDADRRAFLSGYFPDVLKRASAGMDAQAVWNLLFELHDDYNVESAIGRHINNSSPPSRMTPGFQLPPIDPWFTGREKDLKEIERMLAEHRAVTVRGLGGLGKSSLVREYLHQHRSGYSFVAWLSAADASSLESAYIAMANFLDRCSQRRRLVPSPRDPTARLVFTLDELAHQENWLLVLDNADHPKELEKLWPNLEHGFVIVTSRHPNPGRFPVYDLPSWNPEEALDFLRRRSGQSLTGPAETAARKLLAEVESLPLAVEQIGAYLAHNKTPIDQYLQVFQTEHIRPFPEFTTERGSVATVWTASFTEVEFESPASADLLRISAYLSPDGIPEWFLLAAAPELGELLQGTLTPDNPLAVGEVLSPLLRHSLIHRFEAEGGEPHYSVHRLVQTVIRQRLGATNLAARYLERAAAALNLAFPDAKEVTTWPRCRSLMPSVESLWSHAQTLATLSVAALWNGAATYLHELAHYAQAEPLYRRSLAIRETALGPDHPDVAQSLYGLADVMDSLGKLAEAEPLFRRSLVIREQAQGPDHSDVGESLSGLGHVLLEKGKLAEAEPLIHRSRAIREKAFGPDELDVARSLTSLADLLDEQGKPDEAEPLCRRSLTIRERALGPGHPSVAVSLMNLASMINNQRKPAEAEPLFRRSLVILQQTLGPDHPTVATCLCNLANVLTNLDELAEAEPLYRSSLAIREKAFGPDHFVVAHSLDNLARLLANQGKLTEAEPLFDRSLAIRENALGPDHPNVARTLHRLGAMLNNQGKPAEAEPLFRRSLAIREKAFGPDHPDVARSLRSLAGALISQGRPAEAEPLCRRSLVILEKRPGANQIEVAESLKILEILLTIQQRLVEAAPHSRRRLAIIENALGPDHPLTTSARENLRRLVEAQLKTGLPNFGTRPGENLRQLFSLPPGTSRPKS